MIKCLTSRLTIGDVVMGEDANQSRAGQMPHFLAVMSNTALSLPRHQGIEGIALAMRRFAARTMEIQAPPVKNWMALV